MPVPVPEGAVVVFSSAIFLFLFLPLALGLYYGGPVGWRNGTLLGLSLLFYTWGEKEYLLLLLGSLTVNYAFALRLAQVPSRWTLAGAVLFNLGLLVVFKYANFLVENLSALSQALGGPTWHLAPVHLPLGISFFTFQALSYVLDVSRGAVPAQRNFRQFALYVFLFPHLIAGPIVRYCDIADQLARRPTNTSQFAEGIRRFVLGLAKKVLLANQLAVTADAVFNLPAGMVSMSAAWLGLVCYSLQLYFDFSGYSDMAIGLGKMFGFDFQENFNYPYIAQSVTEFWRRWHLSLSSWFRDYLYIPLGGNRVHPLRMYANLMIVFVLCGLWHGASWNFLLWGAYHGAFLIAERLGVGAWVAAGPSVLRHGYALLAVLGGWVFFRASTLAEAGSFWSALLGLSAGTLPAHDFVTRELLVVLPVAGLACTPILPWALAHSERWRERPLAAWAWEVGRLGALGGLLIASVILLAGGTYNPFIYFRF
jgi:alginate O-acetyltransferase complex protein AlgI